jgi:hypothetical protein
MDKHELFLLSVVIGILSLSAFSVTAISAGKEETTYMKLDTLPTVEIGEPLVINGTTNRAEGTQILVTVKGTVELIPAMFRVENGTFNATFDTFAAPEGTYTVRADDGAGHSDEAMVNLRPPTPTPTATVKPAPTPSLVPAIMPTPTPPKPTTLTPEEGVPGFEVVFAFEGLLTLYLIRLRGS